MVMNKAVAQDTLVALIESGAGVSRHAWAGRGGLEPQYPAGPVLAAGALAPGVGQDLGEPDRAGAVL